MAILGLVGEQEGGISKSEARVGYCETGKQQKITTPQSPQVQLEQCEGSWGKNWGESANPILKFNLPESLDDGQAASCSHLFKTFLVS